MFEYYVDGPTMKQVDQYAIETMGIPSMVLMERAAYEVTEVITAHYPKEIGVVGILAGTGNNGADGLAVARMLTDRNYKVVVICVGNQEKATPEWKAQFQIIRHMNIETIEYSGKMDLALWSGQHPVLSRIGIWVDGLFGIGLTREIKGAYLEVIQYVNQTGLPVVAIDIPSGVLSSTGMIAGDALRCAYTVTFGRKKLGTILYPGADYCGKLLVCDVGFTQKALDHAGYQAWGYGKGLSYSMTEGKDIASPYAQDGKSAKLLALKPRPSEGHKGTFGKVLVVAGCETMAGAAVFAAKSAIRMGAGIVKVHTPMCNRDVVLMQVPEAILSLYPDGIANLELLVADIAWADAVVFGPGIGQGTAVYEMLKLTLEKVKELGIPLVLDADGLRCLAAHDHLWSLVTKQVILTPHLGEMQALTGISVKELKQYQLAQCEALVKESGCVCIMKQATPIICSPEQKPCIVTSGCNALGTAGSGDVLAGMVGALCGEGYTAWEAATLGAHIHGMAGSCIGIRMGNRSVCATDLLQGISEVMKLLDET